jgi:hypothetical protein
MGSLAGIDFSYKIIEENDGSKHEKLLIRGPIPIDIKIEVNFIGSNKKTFNKIIHFFLKKLLSSSILHPFHTLKSSMQYRTRLLTRVI